MYFFPVFSKHFFHPSVKQRGRNMGRNSELKVMVMKKDKVS